MLDQRWVTAGVTIQGRAFEHVYTTGIYTEVSRPLAFEV